MSLIIYAVCKTERPIDVHGFKGNIAEVPLKHFTTTDKAQSFINKSIKADVKHLSMLALFPAYIQAHQEVIERTLNNVVRFSISPYAFKEFPLYQIKAIKVY